MLNDPVLGVSPAFADTSYVRLPDPVPLFAPRIVMKASLEFALQLHAGVVVIATVPESALLVNEADAGDSV